MPVEIVHWNPRRPVVRGTVGRLLPLRRRVGNFGDLLGPALVDLVLTDLAIDQAQRQRASGRLVTVGSIMKLSRPADVIWGTGMNGKSMDPGGGPSLDIRAVRGPLTREQLTATGAEVPEIYGDPALLWSRFRPRHAYLAAGPRRDVTIVPNFHDWPDYRDDPRAISPLLPIDQVVGAIARSNFVCGSSLHGIVIADAYGVPARLIKTDNEPAFKYEDYYLGSGRERPRPSKDVNSAIAAGGEPALDWNGDRLLDAFPADLWTSETT